MTLNGFPSDDEDYNVVISFRVDGVVLTADEWLRKYFWINRQQPVERGSTINYS
jgi:hypothetical protein